MAAELSLPAAAGGVRPPQSAAAGQSRLGLERDLVVPIAPPRRIPGRAANNAGGALDGALAPQPPPPRPPPGRPPTAPPAAPPPRPRRPARHCGCPVALSIAASGRRGAWLHAIPRLPAAAGSGIEHRQLAF